MNWLGGAQRPYNLEYDNYLLNRDLYLLNKNLKILAMPYENSVLQRLFHVFYRLFSKKQKLNTNF